MTNGDLVERLNSHLRSVEEMLSLGDLGLLKSEELHITQHKIEDELSSHKPLFEKIEALKIERTIPKLRNEPKTGIFLNSGQVNSALSPLHVLLQELIKAKGGSEQIEQVAVPELIITGRTINQAIEDAKILISTQGATSAVDRIHTVLHGFLKQVCKEAGIPYPQDATLNQLLNTLKTSHPALMVRSENIDQILKSMANVLDKLNPLRNDSSLAHSNPVLLESDEAMLVINTVNTTLSYLNAKFQK